MTVTIYHNPKCGTSRNVLAIIRDSGVEPRIVEYLKTPPSRDEIKGFAEATGLGVRGLLREKGTPYAEMGLDDESLSDDALLDAIEAAPILLNRPIVVTPKGTKLSRPSEAVFELLDTPPESFTKEDGEVIRS